MSRRNRSAPAAVFAVPEQPKRRFIGPLRRHRQQIAEALVADGHDRAEAEQLVGKIGDGSLIKWLIEHQGDVQGLIQFFVNLFAKKGA